MLSDLYAITMLLDLYICFMQLNLNQGYKNRGKESKAAFQRGHYKKSNFRTFKNGNYINYIKMWQKAKPQYKTSPFYCLFFIRTTKYQKVQQRGLEKWPLYSSI